MPHERPHPLTAYGWDDRVATLFTIVDGDAWEPGRVVRVDKGSCLVALPGGARRVQPYALASRRAGVDVDPAVGDWVAVAEDPHEGDVVVAVLPRWSEIARRDPEPGAVRAQVLAANVDTVAVVCPLDRPFSPGRVERSLAAAWDSGASPVVVLTKADVADDLDGAVEEAAGPSGGVEVLVTSAVSGAGLDGLRALVPPGRTLVLLGPSGSGKSSLANRLVGEERQAVGDVRGADHRGRHTTTTRDLMPVPGGGALLDTPGLRSLGLWDAGDGVAGAFPDLEELAAGCRFRDCGHASEPGCAVVAAVETGALDERRLRSYRKLQRELAALELQQDVRARRAAARKWGRMHRDVGAHKRPDR